MIWLIILLEFNFPNFFAGKPSFTKKQADLFFPPDFADDFPVAMQVQKLLELFILQNCADIGFIVFSFGRYPTNTV